MDGSVGATAGVETIVAGAIGVETHDAACRTTIELAEVARHQNLAIGLHRQGLYLAIGAGAGLETSIYRAVYVQPNQIAH